MNLRRKAFERAAKELARIADQEKLLITFLPKELMVVEVGLAAGTYNYRAIGRLVLAAHINILDGMNLAKTIMVLSHELAHHFAIKELGNESELGAETYIPILFRRHMPLWVRLVLVADIWAFSQHYETAPDIS